VLNRLHNGDAEVMPGFYLLKADAKFDEIDRAIVNEFSARCLRRRRPAESKCLRLILKSVASARSNRSLIYRDYNQSKRRTCVIGLVERPRGWCTDLCTADPCTV
jgi:hypothetical protein